MHTHRLSSILRIVCVLKAGHRGACQFCDLRSRADAVCERHTFAEYCHCMRNQFAAVDRPLERSAASRNTRLCLSPTRTVGYVAEFANSIQWESQPQRIMTVSRSTASQFNRMTGWKVCGATFQLGPKSGGARPRTAKCFASRKMSPTPIRQGLNLSENGRDTTTLRTHIHDHFHSVCGEASQLIEIAEAICECGDFAQLRIGEVDGPAAGTCQDCLPECCRHVDPVEP